MALLLFACDPRVPLGKASPRTGPIHLPSSAHTPYSQTSLPPPPDGEKTDQTKEGAAAAGGPPPKFPLKGDIGVLECQNQQKEGAHFNQKLKEFLSTTEDIGRMDWAVRCSNQRPDLKGGAFIKGNVTFTGGKRYKPSARRLEVSSNSHLELHLIDIYGKNIKSVSMDAEPYQPIEGDHIDLTFQDQHGKLNMRGRVEGEVFSGVLYFENIGRGGGHSGRIGFFRILACNFLSC